VITSTFSRIRLCAILHCNVINALSDDWAEVLGAVLFQTLWLTLDILMNVIDFASDVLSFYVIQQDASYEDLYIPYGIFIVLAGLAIICYCLVSVLSLHAILCKKSHDEMMGMVDLIDSERHRQIYLRTGEIISLKDKKNLRVLLQKAYHGILGALLAFMTGALEDVPFAILNGIILIRDGEINLVILISFALNCIVIGSLPAGYQALTTHLDARNQLIDLIAEVEEDEDEGDDSNHNDEDSEPSSSPQYMDEKHREGTRPPMSEETLNCFSNPSTGHFCDKHNHQSDKNTTGYLRGLRKGKLGSTDTGTEHAIDVSGNSQPRCNSDRIISLIKGFRMRKDAVTGHRGGVLSHSDGSLGCGTQRSNELILRNRASSLELSEGEFGDLALAEDEQKWDRKKKSVKTTSASSGSNVERAQKVNRVLRRKDRIPRINPRSTGSRRSSVSSSTSSLNPHIGDISLQLARLRRQDRTLALDELSGNRYLKGITNPKAKLKAMYEHRHVINKSQF